MYIFSQKISKVCVMFSFHINNSQHAYNKNTCNYSGMN